jgi:SNF2 family DNA or RNA helicase
MAVARLEIGGKYNNQIILRGNRQFLPAAVKRVLYSFFGGFTTLRDLADYPQLIEQLGQVRADKHFLGTDWEALSALHRQHMQRHTLVLSGETEGGAPCFRLRPRQSDPARPIAQLLRSCADGDGRLRDSFDIWRVEKLLRRARAHLTYDKSFILALRRFGADALSFEESLSFFRQVQAYHSAQFLRADLGLILNEYMDSVHTLRLPLHLPELAERLQAAGARLRLHPTVEPVLAHYSALAEATGEAGNSAGIAAQLQGLLRTELYPFQREGVAFLAVTRRALLADDMGLGKTLQAIAAALYLKRQGLLKRVLIVCPASLKYQWQAEIQRFSGERCEVVAGAREERAAIYRAAASTGLYVDPEDRPLFYVINYELALRDAEELKQFGAELLILDEAQRVKNFRAKTSQAVFELPVPLLFVLTGTPLENELMELFTIMRFIDERCLGRNPLAFRDRYVVLDQYGGITGYKLVEEVTRKIAAVTLRRTREQTLSQLPELIEQLLWLDLTDVQRQIYKELQGQARQVLSQDVWDSVAANNALTALQRLREVCDTPELIDPQQRESQKLGELKALLAEQVGLLDRQVLIFTQWTRMGEILVRELHAAGFEPLFLHGGVPAPQRQGLVQRFQDGSGRILISTDAGGTGLNLQAASLVVNYDLPFNPAKLKQRIARAHRLGQKQTVFAVNMLCRNTVETKLWQLLQTKQQLFDDVFGEISDPGQRTAAPQRSLRELLWELVE